MDLTEGIAIIPIYGLRWKVIEYGKDGFGEWRDFSCLDLAIEYAESWSERSGIRLNVETQNLVDIRKGRVSHNAK